LTPNLDITDTYSTEKKLELAIQYSFDEMGPELAAELRAFFSPSMLVGMGVGLTIWGVGHLFAVSDIVDVVLLGVGYAFVGKEAIEAGAYFAEFLVKAKNAKKDVELREAGKLFAKAAVVFGKAIFDLLLLVKATKLWKESRAARLAAKSGGIGKVRGLVKVEPPPPSGTPLKIIERVMGVNNRGRVSLGETSYYGDISIDIFLSQTKKIRVLAHEKLHRFLSPQVAPFRHFRANLKASGYLRSAWLMAMEEMMAEMRAALDPGVNGRLSELLGSFTFPVRHGYVTVTQLVREGQAAAFVMFEGVKYQIFIDEIMSYVEKRNMTPNVKKSVMPQY
jgi:hypothetical protein